MAALFSQVLANECYWSMVLTFALAAMLAHSPTTPVATHASALPSRSVTILATPASMTNSSSTKPSSLDESTRIRDVLKASKSKKNRHTVAAVSHASNAKSDLAVDLHPMSEDERRLYPGRERFDKTEWYESQFKSAKIVTIPEHVDEWNNGGVEVA
jgi:hypothetical protein